MNILKIFQFLTFGLLGRRTVLPLPMDTAVPKIGTPWSTYVPGDPVAGEQKADTRAAWVQADGDPNDPATQERIQRLSQQYNLDAMRNAVLKFYERLCEVQKLLDAAFAANVSGSAKSLPTATLPNRLYIRWPGQFYQIPEPVELTELTRQLRRGNTLLLVLLLGSLWEHWAPNIVEDEDYPVRPDGMEWAMKKESGEEEPAFLHPARIVTPKYVIDIDELDNWKVAQFLCMPKLMADELANREVLAAKMRKEHPDLSLEGDSWMSPMGVSISREAFMLEVFCWVTTASVLYCPEKLASSKDTDVPNEKYRAKVRDMLSRRRSDPMHWHVNAEGELVRNNVEGKAAPSPALERVPDSKVKLVGEPEQI